MRRDYEFALQVNSRPVWDAFVEKYPSGFLPALAEAEPARTAAIAEEAKVAEAARVKTAEAAKAAAEMKIAPEQRAIDDKVATLTPPAGKSDQQTVDLPRSLQSELRRVGCHTGSIDCNWNAASHRSIDLFNKHTGMKPEIKVASVDAL